MKNIFQSKTFKTIIMVLAVLAAALIIFSAGIQVGFRKAQFSCQWGENYEKNFGAPRSLISLPPDDGLVGGHGSFGKIIKINLPEIVIQNEREAEKVVTFDAQTQIRLFQKTIGSSVLKIGDTVVVIGTPADDSGVIHAEFVRVLPNGLPGQATTTEVSTTSRGR